MAYLQVKMCPHILDFNTIRPFRAGLRIHTVLRRNAFTRISQDNGHKHGNDRTTLRDLSNWFQTFGGGANAVEDEGDCWVACSRRSRGVEDFGNDIAVSVVEDLLRAEREKIIVARL